MFNYNWGGEGTLQTRYDTKADSWSMNRNLSGALAQKNVRQSIKRTSMRKSTDHSITLGIEKNKSK